MNAAAQNTKNSPSQSREQQIAQFLKMHGHGASARAHLTGDASTRAYELITRNNQPSLILMNAPPQPDGPPIRDGRPYSQIAHLAEDMRAFVGVAQRLQDNGFRVPNIYAQDLDQGLLLIENLGDEGIIDSAGQPISERYRAAMETLAQIHNCTWPTDVELPDGSFHTLPAFDRDAILIEVDLLARWYAPYRLGAELTGQQVSKFSEIWQDLVAPIGEAETSILLRDYHSPNIIWQAQETGTDRTGLIDFQDALKGPAAYDVASIAQDARVEVSANFEAELIDYYLHCRDSTDPEAFRQAYAILAAQRATKVLGIFVRLFQRDKKSAYLAHIPHVESYLRRTVNHPILADYRNWLKQVINF